MDFKQIKAELDKINSSGTGGSFSDNDLFWKPEPGKQIIRFIPNPHSPDFPFVKLQLYYGIFGKTVVSPASFGEEDPVLDFARKLYNSKDEDKIVMAKKLFPTTRTFAPVVVKDSSGNVVAGPSWWNFGKTIYVEILGIIDDPDYGDITDPLTGRDVTVEYTLGSGKNDREQRFNATTMLRVKPNVSEGYDAETAKKIEELKDIKEVHKCPTADEMKQMLEKYLSGGESAEQKTEDVPDDNDAEDTNNDEVKERVDKAMSELDDLFNKLD